MNQPDHAPPEVRLIGPPEAVPVFNCRAIVSRTADTFTARAAELPPLSATGNSQREALQKLVAAFKSQMKAYLAAKEEIPWVRPGETLGEGEAEFLIAVHL